MSTSCGGLFGSSGTAAFGSTASGLDAFGTTSNTLLSGQTLQPVTQPASGTTMKFIPVTGTDMMQRNGQISTISTKIHCIACMKEYEGESLEELRYEDYLANRKGVSQGVKTGSGIYDGTSQSTVFGFRNAASTAGGDLFGNSGGSFGETSVFGQSSGLPTSNGLFGELTSTTPIWQTQRPATQFTSPFGRSTIDSAYLFRFTAGAFAPGATAAAGTRIKFIPVTGSDTMQRSGETVTYNTKHYCITCMNEYEGKSLEELRYEDYLANRKGHSQGVQTGGMFFGGSGQSTLFGSATSTASTTGGGLFGSSGRNFGQSCVFGQRNCLQTNNSPFGKAASTSPFGATTTTLPTGFGTFGQQTTLFGANAQQAKPAFGVSQPSTGLFGSTTPATTGFGTQPVGFGGFSAQQPQQSQGIGLFGQSQNKFGDFGAQTTSSFPFGQNTGTNSTSLFGQKPPTTGSGWPLSVLLNKPVATLPSFGSNTTAAPTLGGTNLNGGSLFASSVQKLISLFDNSADFGTGTGSGFATSSNTGFGGFNSGSTRLGNLGRAQPAKKSSLDKDFEDVKRVLRQQKANLNYLNLKLKSMMKKSKLSSDRTTTQTSLSVDKANKENTGTGNSTYSVDTTKSPSTNTSSFIDNTILATSPALNKSTSISAKMHTPPTTCEDNTMAELRSPTKSSETKKNVSFVSDTLDASNQSYYSISSFISEKSEYKEKDNEIETGNDSEKEHACGITLRRPDYFTVPSLSELDEMVDDDGKCVLKHFIIGHHNFGNVTFLDAVDVAGLDLDSIVFFRHKEVVLYPNDAKKPPIGVELNRRARVSLDGVWPRDKTNRQVITDPERLKQLEFVDKLKRSSEKINAQFIEYRPETGSWVFEVEHFSKYGLEDSDDDTHNP